MKKTTTPESNTDQEEGAVSGRLHKFVMAVFFRKYPTLWRDIEMGEELKLGDRWIDGSSYNFVTENVISFGCNKTLKREHFPHQRIVKP